VIAGAVNAAYEPVITLAVQGPAGRPRDIDAVIDTGFGGLLTLPPALVAELGLLFKGTGLATLADGSTVDFPYYGVTVLWDGQRISIEAEAADTTPLVGMRLLDGHSLYMEVEDGGRVVIQASE
jgi:clan AA aspartic protease